MRARLMLTALALALFLLPTNLASPGGCGPFPVGC
jgi:hypothetical protein